MVSNVKLMFNPKTKKLNLLKLVCQIIFFKHLIVFTVSIDALKIIFSVEKDLEGYWISKINKKSQII